MSNPQATINRILHGTLIDGPGVRIALFFQGCNFKCRYCHNPETQNFCRACGACALTCPTAAVAEHGGVDSYRAERCVHCYQCLKTCPHHSSPHYRTLTIDDLIKEVEASRDFIDGITFSGGECTLQSDFLVSAMKALRKKFGDHFSFYIDSNGLIEKPHLSLLMDHASGFLLDIKAMSRKRHRFLTGKDNKLVLHNAVEMAKRRLLYEVRSVLVCNTTAIPSEIIASATFINHLAKLNAPRTLRWKLIPFRPEGVRDPRAQEEMLISKEVYDNCCRLAKRSYCEQNIITV
ncbi:MAG: YjjW family glycine radical enzyme activase [Oligoflexia bacterium]|nr:YjjW family glycine radical enzyme activase [Oligoflexia bacterium]MBF0364671.1 YjjW family glycine radical enzyme activase [Oligoflexia bacterium]